MNKTEFIFSVRW